MRINEQVIQVQGIKTRYYQAGERGSVVVLLHGGGTDSAKLSWGEVIEPLAESGHRVIAPDLPGYGGSDIPDIRYSTAFYLEFLKSFLGQLEIQKTSFMGLSMGGGVSLGFTLANPQSVEKLVLVDSYGIQRRVAMHFLSWLMVKIPGIMEGTWKLERSSPAMTRWAMSNVVRDPEKISPELMDELMIAVKRPFSERAFTSYQRDEVFLKGLKTVYIDRLHEIKTPTLIVHGEKDGAVPLACAEETHRLIVGSQLAVFKGAGHWAQRESPQEFIQVVNQFLKDSQKRIHNKSTEG
jgi:pimeloyl-ACP methyl ester carboxylesterase